MNVKSTVLTAALVAVVVGGVGVAMQVDALDREEIEARREQRRLEREARRAARDAERAARDAEREAERAARDAERAAEDNGCSCRASLKLTKPQLTWSNGTLKFVPRVDVDIRSRGEVTAPDWTAKLDYSGYSTYMSEDLSVPSGVSFSGSKTLFNGSCGNSFSYDGIDLPAVSLSGVTSSLVGIDEELEGSVHMEAMLSGCDIDVEKKKFEFRVRDLIDLKVKNWRTDR